MNSIQKEREAFEVWVKSKGRVVERFSDGSYKSMTLDKEWEAWQAAKANAVPEGYKLVPIDSVAVNKKEIPAIREALHIMNFKHGDVRGDFASADAAIEKAIEATQEPAND